MSEPEVKRGQESSGGTQDSALSADERSQVAARLRLSPAERLRYLMDILAFEDLAGRARRVG